MGHSSITVTFDLDGHLMPGTEAEGAALLDAYLGAQVDAGEQAAREGASPQPTLLLPPAPTVGSPAHDRAESS